MYIQHKEGNKNDQRRNKIEMRKTVKQIYENKTQCSEKINKTDRLWARLRKTERDPNK